MPVSLCDPHSPWQRPSHENLNGLVRQQLPKGIDLTICSLRDLDKIAHSLNTRPRAVLGFQAPEDGFMAELSKFGGVLQM
jgi:transposase, IS30 family